MQLPSFWCGVWAQPSARLPLWKSQGCNLAVGSNPMTPETQAQWRSTCASLGMWYIDTPVSVQDVEVLVSDPWCLALMLPDEPEINANLPWYTDPNFQNVLNTWMATWKPRFDAVNGRKRIWANFGGSHIYNARPTYQGQLIAPFVSQCHVTDISFDIYPINDNILGDWSEWNANPPNPENDPFIVKGDTLQVYALKLLDAWFPTQTKWAYIECEQYNVTNTLGRGPTSAEMMQQAKALVAAGIKGIVYFADCLNSNLPWDPTLPSGQTAFDGRNADQIAGCIAVNQRLLGVPAVVVLSPTPITPASVDLGPLTVRIEALEAGLASLKAETISDVTISIKRGV